MTAAKLEVGQGGKCRVCGRVLRNEASRAAGIGPVCARKGGAKETGPWPLPAGSRAEFEVVKLTAEAIWLRDLDKGRTITNDADEVTAAMLKLYGPRRVYYRDTMGRWDELEHNGRAFVGFKAGAPEPSP